MSESFAARLDMNDGTYIYAVSHADDGNSAVYFAAAPFEPENVVKITIFSLPYNAGQPLSLQENFSFDI